MNDLTQYSNYILKTMVRGVALCDSSDPDTNECPYKLLKIELNDIILQKIIEEGAKYGLDREQCVNMIRLTDEKIVFNPSIKRILWPLLVSSLDIGERIDLSFENPDIGPVTISALLHSRSSLMVLESGIGGLEYRDILRPMHQAFNPGHKVFFKVWRKGVEITSETCRLCPGKLLYIERYRPSFLFSILDNDSTFAYNENQARTDSPDKPPKSTKTAALNNPNAREQAKDATDNLHFVGFPITTTPPCWKNEELTRLTYASAPFIIHTITQIPGTAEITVNPDFCLSKKRNIWTYEINMLDICCAVNDGNLPLGSRIETVAPGKLIYKSLGDSWILTERPQIKSASVPNLDARLCKIISSAILKVLHIIITTNDFDKSLSELGADIHKKWAIATEIETLSKISIPVTDTQITIRDIYNQLKKNYYHG